MMNVTEIVLNQCIRIFKPSPDRRPQDNVKALQLVRGCEARYGFYQGPHVVADYNPDAGITFLSGQFQCKFLINKFQFFRTGILVEGIATTDVLDEFLDDVTSWAQNEMGVPPGDGPTSRAYLSQVEVQCDVAFAEAFAQFSDLGLQISEAVRSYGQNCPPFEATNLTLFADPTDLPLPRPGSGFVFSRRDGKPFSSGLFFATAPLKSADHYRMLDRFERLLTAKISAS